MHRVAKKKKICQEYIRAYHNNESIILFGSVGCIDCERNCLKSKFNASIKKD